MSNDVVERWFIDAHQYLGEMKKINAALREYTEQLRKQEDQAEKTGAAVGKAFKFSELTAKINIVKGVVKSVDEVLSDAGRLGALTAEQGAFIEKARTATQGLIADSGLMASAAKASAQGLGLTTDQFAKLSSAAVVLADKVGMDAPQALSTLVQGLGRGKESLLAQLGVVVDTTEVYEKFAEQLGKTGDQLNDAEKRSALLADVMGKLDQATGGARASIDGSGDAWDKLKNSLDNVATAFKVALDRGGLLQGLFSNLAITADVLASALRMPSSKANDAAMRNARFGIGDSGDQNSLAYWIKKQQSEKRGALDAESAAASAALARAREQQAARNMRRIWVPGGITVREGGDPRAKARTLADMMRSDAMSDVMRLGEAEIGQEIAANDNAKKQAEQAARARAGMQNYMADLRGADADAFAENQFQKLLGKNALASLESGGVLARMFPQDDFIRIAKGFEELEKGAGSYAITLQSSADIMSTFASGAMATFVDALFEAAEGQKSLGEAMRDAFKQFLLTFSKQMLLESLKHAAMATAYAFIPGMQWASGGLFTAAGMFAAAGAAAGAVGAAIPGGKKATGAAGGRGVSRGVGGPASTGPMGGSTGGTFIYNINTITPPDKDQAAAIIGELHNRAINLGYARRAA